MRWYTKIVHDTDADTVGEALDHFQREYRDACNETKDLHGKRLIEAETMLPGIAGYRLEQQKELESILGYLEIQIDALIGAKRRHYLEHYNRSLGDRMVEKYAETDPAVISLRELHSHIAAMHRQFAALSKHHEYLHFQLGNISKLRAAAAGVPDAVMALDLVNSLL